MGDKVFHVGQKPGQGATVKTVNQLLCGVHIAVAAEALSLAEKAGIDGKLLFEIMGGSAASSWMLRDRGPRMLLDDAARSPAPSTSSSRILASCSMPGAPPDGAAAGGRSASDVPGELGPRPWRAR